jgi:hypothetical protein
MFIIADKRPMQQVGRIKVVAKRPIRFAGKAPVKVPVQSRLSGMSLVEKFGNAA